MKIFSECTSGWRCPLVNDTRMAENVKHRQTGMGAMGKQKLLEITRGR